MGRHLPSKREILEGREGSQALSKFEFHWRKFHSIWLGASLLCPRGQPHPARPGLCSTALPSESCSPSGRPSLSTQAGIVSTAIKFSGALLASVQFSASSPWAWGLSHLYWPLCPGSWALLVGATLTQVTSRAIEALSAEHTARCANHPVLLAPFCSPRPPSVFSLNSLQAVRRRQAAPSILCLEIAA